MFGNTTFGSSLFGGEITSEVAVPITVIVTGKEVLVESGTVTVSLEAEPVVVTVVGQEVEAYSSDVSLNISIATQELCGVQRRTRRAAVVATKKLRTYITFPEFSVANVWRGASEIVKQFNFTLDEVNNITQLFKTAPNDANFCPCIAWKTGADTIVRYKLWNNVGEILYVPLYEGQAFTTDFRIEIWNTPDTNLVGGPYKLYLSKLIIASCRCESDDFEVGLDYRVCTDVILNLTDYVPIDGDYYVRVGDCGEADLVHIPEFGNADYIVLQSSDDTWHKVNTILSTDPVTGDNFITFYVDPTNTDPAELSYFPMLSNDSKVYKVNLLAYDDGDGTNHYLRIDGEVITTTSYSKINLLNLTSADYNGVRLVNSGGELNFSFV